MTGIAIVAPSGYAPDNDAVEKAIERLKAQNFRVYNYYCHSDRFKRFGATDALRMAQLNEAVSNRDVDIVIALRGGYGMSRLLKYIDFRGFARSKKFFVGHSDFTAFQLGLLHHANGISFAGPMICNDFTHEAENSFTIDEFWKCLKGPAYSVKLEQKANPEAYVEGVLWGGNMTMLVHLIGTRFMPQIDGGILFIEDIHEHPFRVERMLAHLNHAKILSRQKALVLGHFSEYTLSEYDNGYDFEAMLRWARSNIPIPVITGLPFGHMQNKVTLPIGARSHIRSGQGEVLLTVSDYPTLELPDIRF